MPLDDDYGLGRRVEHDPRSRNFPFRARRSAAEIRTIRWYNRGPRLDQGSVGACTGFTAANFLNTYPAHKSRSAYYQNKDGLRWYSRATELDIWDGWYNLATGRVDTGSSGNAACKALREEGRILSWHWIFEGTEQLKLALLDGPVMAGTTWTDSMFDPDDKGYLDVAGSPVGGHEYLIIGWNQRSRYFTMLNSWGIGWGARGHAKISDGAMAELLADRGDLVVPVPNG
jgi:hypothetical protein